MTVHYTSVTDLPLVGVLFPDPDLHATVRHPGRAVTRAERGGVSMLMLAVLVVGLVLATGAARLGGALVGRARAEAAADAAALAAADRLALGDGSAAARAAADATAASNDARLVSCDCSGTTRGGRGRGRRARLGCVVGPARGRAKAEVRPECVVELPGC